MCNNLFAADRRIALLEVIDQELSEVSRLNQQSGNRDPRLRLRVAELLLEKARIIKDQENQAYLSIPAKKRRGGRKSQYFKKSTNLFKQAQKTAQAILRHFKKFKGIGEVYYILAYNSKEFNKHKQSFKYFKLAEKHLKRGSVMHAKAQASLGDIYYNRGDYNRAIPRYQQALKFSNDQWWTKDGFNLAWCFFRTKKYKQAISLMKEVYKRSNSSKYIDMSRFVSRDLALFYSEAGQVEQAIAFYRSIGSNISSHLLELGKHLVTQGKFAAAEQAMAAALRHKQSLEEEIQVNNFLLKLYGKHGKLSKQLSVAKRQRDIGRQQELGDERHQELIFQLKRISALLQKQVVGKYYRRRPKVKAKRARQAVEAFLLLAEMEPSKQARHQLLAGETLYAAKEYPEAYSLYEKSYLAAKKTKNRKIIKTSLDGMMATISDKRRMSQKDRDDKLMHVYNYFLLEYPKGKKSYHIYQRQFALLIAQKKLEAAEKMMLRFRLNFPRDFSKQEAMLAEVTEYYRQAGDLTAITRWLQLVNKGEFKASPKFLKRIRYVYTQMQFQTPDGLEDKKNWKGALQAYADIYQKNNTKGGSLEAMRIAAFNIARLFHQLGDGKRSYEWSLRAIKHMSASNVKEFRKQFLSISTDLFNQQHFNESATLSSLIFDRLCKFKSADKKVFFKNAYVVFLSDGKVKEAKKVIARGEQCRIPKSSIKQAKLDYLKAMLNRGEWQPTIAVLRQLGKSKKLWPDLISHWGDIKQRYIDQGQKSKAVKLNPLIRKYYLYSVKNRAPVPLKGLDVVAQMELKKLNILKSSLNAIGFRFPAKVYNQLLAKKNRIISRILAHSLDIMKIGSGIGTVRAYEVLIDSLHGLATEIREFTPQDKTPEFIASFKGSMSKLALMLEQKADDYKVEVRNKIVNNRILAAAGFKYLVDSKKALPLLKYSYPPGGIIMGRRGN
ncbi:MAG: tetratricopeptide repeat protein [Bdellovibrionales bacterium]|nr:tetratricopeptide repeat protein [Bdellovibrionales bacterium]MBT3527126.1 tetratricopeptide repeat protein [Bdellovibrionales bacterium]MBT7668109.1 tetratricopeptide repeat protein [Bdellovibrionales bacterium]MBT7766159.1 tetratricopeptide repeat protein [Bdellovibrionales bacterium]